MSAPKKQPKADGDLDWISYHPYTSINAWLDRLQAEFPQFVTIETYGYSYEGKPLKLAKLSKKAVIEIIFYYWFLIFKRVCFLAG